MYTTAFHPPAAARPFPGATSRWVQVLVTALLAADRWCTARRRRRDDLDTLGQMSDHALRDLGLHRQDVVAPGSPFQPVRCDPW